MPAILKGEVSYINGTTHLASQVAYECTPGNRLSGHRVRYCGPDSRWTGSSPKCEEVRCEAPGLPANGSAIYIGNDRSFKEQSFSVGVTVQYECDYGHVVKGSWSSRLCQANGEWSGEPPLCKFVDCGPPPSIENGNYLLKHPPAPSAAAVASSSIGPMGGAALAEPTLRRSDGGGGSPGSTGGGQPTANTYYGTIVHYSCDANYKLQGPGQRECLESGQWRTPLPSCEPVQCPRPEVFDEFTQVALIPRSGAQQQASEPTSSADQQPAAKSIRLIANNQWLTHPQDSSSATTATATTFGVGDKLHFTCAPGYELYGGPEVRTCTQYGQWSGSSTPRCRHIDCGRPAPIGQEGRFFLLNETTTFNSLVEYSCVRPFKLIEVKIRQAGNLIETLTNAQAGVTPILTSLPIGVKVCANNGQWMPNDQQPKCTSGALAGGLPSDSAGRPSGGGASHAFDGADNTLDGSHRQSNQDASPADNHLDAASGHHKAAQPPSGSLWAKLIVAICLLVMLALIILTLICIRSGKKPKQVAIHRASILTPSGHQAVAAAAIQIQLANSKSLHQPPGGAQNIYVNGMQKLFPAATVMSSSSGHPNQMTSLTGHSLHHHHSQGSVAYGEVSGATGTGSMVTVGGQGEVLADGKSLAMVQTAGAYRIRVAGELPMSSSSSSVLDSYSRLSIESDQQSGANGPAAKTIRHNPNGLVTFVSPAQQNRSGQASQSGGGSIVGAGAGATSQHQASPQSISTSLSLSSSSSPSSSSSAHHTTATRLSTTDSASSPSSGSADNQGQHNHHHHHHHGGPRHQQNEYQAPQQFGQVGHLPAPQTSPPSLPAHPPPPHRVQQHHKQLLRHQQNSGRQRANQAERQVGGQAPNSKGHYMEPGL